VRKVLGGEDGLRGEGRRRLSGLVGEGMLLGWEVVGRCMA